MKSFVFYKIKVKWEWPRNRDMVCWDTGEGEEGMDVCIGTTCLSNWFLSEYTINSFASVQLCIVLWAHIEHLGQEDP